MDLKFFTRRDGQVEEFTMEVPYFAKVEEIKQGIGRLKEVPVASMQLYLNGIELINGKTTENYPIVEGSRIRFVYYDE